MPDYTPPTTPHLGLPLPSPDAPSQRADVERVALALTLVDAALERQRLERWLGLDPHP